MQSACYNRTPFSRLVREIMQNLGSMDLRIQSTTLLTIQEPGGRGLYCRPYEIDWFGHHSSKSSHNIDERCDLISTLEVCFVSRSLSASSLPFPFLFESSLQIESSSTILVTILSGQQDKYFSVSWELRRGSWSQSNDRNDHCCFYNPTGLNRPALSMEIIRKILSHLPQWIASLQMVKSNIRAVSLCPIPPKTLEKSSRMLLRWTRLDLEGTMNKGCYRSHTATWKGIVPLSNFWKIFIFFASTDEGPFGRRGLFWSVCSTEAVHIVVIEMFFTGSWIVPLTLTLLPKWWSRVSRSRIG